MHVTHAELPAVIMGAWFIFLTAQLGILGLPSRSVTECSNEDQTCLAIYLVEKKIRQIPIHF